MRLAALVAVGLASLSAANCAPRSSSRMVELHRTVFETINPGLPQTKAVAEAQIELAAAYVKGRRVDRDIEFGCGLALNARGSSQRLLEDGPLRVQWHFEGAPQFGSGTFGLLGGPENAP